MDLEAALNVLVRDWIDLHEQGGTRQSVEALLGLFTHGGTAATAKHLSPSQVVELLLQRLAQVPEMRENVERFMTQFSTPGELLEDVDLADIVRDLGITAPSEHG